MTRKSFHVDYVKPAINMKSAVYAAAELRGDEKILDVACGFGDLLQYIQARGHKGKLSGIDLSKGMIDAARKSKNIEFVVGNAESLGFDDESFDLVICRHALYHFDHIDKAVDEIYRVLKKDGKLIFTLNSLANNSRSHIEQFKRILAKQLKCDYLDNNHRINMENYGQFFRKFKILKEQKYFSYVDTTDAKAVVGYVDTLREFYTPLPESQDWQQALQVVEREINREIKAKGSFKEVMGSGLVLLQK